MTSHSDTPGHDDTLDPDELVSAYLDGETTAAESARIEGDVDLLARVETLARVRAQLEVDPQPPAAADAQRSAALAAFDELDFTAGDETPPGTVTDLASRRRPWHQRMPLGAVAAAIAVVALAAGVVAGFDLTSDSSGGDDMAASELGDQDDVTLDAGASGVDAAELAPAADGSDGARLAFADADALAAHLRARLEPAGAPTAGSGGSSSGAAGGGGGGGSAPLEEPDATPDGAEADTEAARAFDPCDAVQVSGVDPNTVRLVDGFVLRGIDVTAVVHTDGDADQVVVVADESCEIIERRPL